MTRSVLDAYARALRWAQHKYGAEIGAGLYRRVFADGDAYVVKVPRDAVGEYCNEGEAAEAPDDARLARCTLFARYGVQLLRMERIIRFPRTAREFARLPGWTTGIDCQQVGWTVDGRLVAYDWVYPQR